MQFYRFHQIFAQRNVTNKSFTTFEIFNLTKFTNKKKNCRSISKTKAPKHDKWIRRQKKQGMILPGTLKTIKKTPLIKPPAM